VKDRAEREASERDRDLQHDDLRLQHSSLITDQVVQMERDRRRRAEELAHYHKEQEREKKNKDVALRAADIATAADDSTLFLQFAGEDRGKPERVQAQQTQQQDWLAQQLALLREKESRDVADEKDYAETQKEILELKNQVEQEHQHNRAAARVQTKEANMQLAQVKKGREQKSKALDESERAAELSATISSPFMTEQVPVSAFGAHRVVPYAFKGMSVEQRQAILDEQARQKLVTEAKKADDDDAEAEYARQQEELRKERLRQARVQEAVRQQGRITLREEQKVQKREHDLKHDYLKKVVYQNPVHPSYFEQFGKSCR